MEQIIMFRVLHFTKKYGKILRTVKVLPYARQLNIISRRENAATNNTRRESMEFSRRITYSHNNHVTAV